MDWTAGTALVALLVFMPLVFGVVHASSEMVALAVGAGLAAILAIRLLWVPQTIGRGWLPWLLPTAFCSLIFIQLLPMPLRWARVISPNTVAIKTNLLSDLPEAAEVLRYTTLSFNPHDGSHDVRIVLLNVVVFLTVLTVFRSVRRVLVLLSVIAAIGVALAILALMQKLTHATGIYWRIPIDADTWMGTFVNHSHFAQQMNLSIGAMFSLLLVSCVKSPAGTGVRTSRIFWRVVLAIAVAVATLSVLMSMSRGGIVANLIGSALLMAALIAGAVLQKRYVVAGLILSVSGAGLILLGLGFDWRISGIGIVPADGGVSTNPLARKSDASASMPGEPGSIVGRAGEGVSSRLTTLRNPTEYSDRLTTATDCLSILRLLPLAGAGLGTHLTFYPGFDHTLDPRTSTHAENEYAQMAEETGVLGLGCIFVFLAVVWIKFAACVRAGGLVAALALGIGFGLIAVTIHSLSDFGPHLPAIGCLSAVSCACLFNLAGVTRGGQTAASTVAVGWRGARVGGALLILAAGSWALGAAIDAKQAEAATAPADRIAARLRAREWAGSAEEYDRLMAAAGAACDADPQDVRLKYQLLMYTAERAIHVPVAGISESQTNSDLRQIVVGLSRARLLCPTFSSLYSLQAQIELSAFGDLAAGSLSMRRAASLNRHNPNACFAAGTLDVRDGLWLDAAEHFTNTLLFDPGRASEVLRVYRENDAVGLALGVALENPDWQHYLAGAIGRGDLADLADQNETVALIQACRQRYPRVDYLVRLAYLLQCRGRDEPAATCWRRAVDLEPLRADWRLSLVHVLVRLNRLDQAKAELEAFSLAQPGNPDVTQLLTELRHKP